MYDTIKIGTKYANPFVGHTFSPAVAFEIIQVGVGGNGGYLVPRLAKMIAAFLETDIRANIYYTIVDGDVVETKNLNRQLFIAKDVGQKKVTVLANRYSGAYNIPIYTHPHYIENWEQLYHLFIHYTGAEHLVYDEENPIIPVLIGCVDNNATRKIMHEVFYKLDTCVYIDTGIDGVIIDKDASKDRIKKSGYSGHVVCGYKKDGKVILEDVIGIYPSILEDQESLLPTQTCQQAVIDNPQRMQTNEMAALITCGYLNNLLGEREIVTHYTNFNARNHVVRSKFIEREETKDEENQRAFYTTKKMDAGRRPDFSRSDSTLHS